MPLMPKDKAPSVPPTLPPMNNNAANQGIPGTNGANQGLASTLPSQNMPAQLPNSGNGAKVSSKVSAPLPPEPVSLLTLQTWNLQQLGKFVLLELCM